MTSLPPPVAKKLGLVIDLDICVGCHACAVACKEWNDGGDFGPLLDKDAYGAEPSGIWFNRVHSYAVEPGVGSRDSGFSEAVSRSPSEYGLAYCGHVARVLRVVTTQPRRSFATEYARI